MGLSYMGGEQGCACQCAANLCGHRLVANTPGGSVGAHAWPEEPLQGGADQRTNRSGLDTHPRQKERGGKAKEPAKPSNCFWRLIFADLCFL